jgi:hypothetical protein
MKKLIVGLPLLGAACTTAPVPAPKPRVAAPAPRPAAPPPAPTPAADWRDRPYTPGAWHYADHAATYGLTGAPPLLTMRCDLSRRLVLLSVAGSATTLTIRTSYAQRDWPAQAAPDGRSQVSFAPTDPQLDQIAFSRGRFSVSGPNLPEIDVPAWAEPSRAIEDCRD